MKGFDRKGFAAAMLGLAAVLAVPLASGPARAGEVVLGGEFVGTDPYNRQVYARGNRVATVPSQVEGPYFRKTTRGFGAPRVAGPLYYAQPAPPVSGIYRPDDLVAAGAVLGFDQDAALARAEYGIAERGVSVRPAPFSGEWYRDCAARYRSFDRETGTYQPHSGPRRLCR